MNETLNLASPGRLVNFSPREKKALKREFERAAIPHLSHLYTAAFYLTRDQREAEDLLQDTYLRAYRFFHKFDPGTNCRAWLLSIQRHLFINRYRKQKQQPELVDWTRIDREYESFAIDEEHTEKYSPETLFASRAMAPEIEQALQALPEEFRSAVILVDLQELNYDEAANVMECPVGTVRSRLSRGRRLLQVALRNYALQHGIIKE